VAAQTIGPFALGSVAVTDGCGGVAGWVASVISTAFTGGSGTPATAITYTPTTATKTGTVTVTPASPVVDLTTVKPVQTATAVNGANTGAWSLTLTVAVPAGAQAATYSATVTHSVA
jgi:hypothetical protein